MSHSAQHSAWGPVLTKLFRAYGAGFLRNRSTVSTPNQFSHLLRRPALPERCNVALPLVTL